MLKYSYVPYIWLLIASSSVTLFLGIYAAIKRRNAKGVTSFIASMFVLTVWSLANALEISSSDFGTKLFWANIQYFAYCFSPVALFGLCSEFAGYGWLVKSKKILWLAILPTLIFILIWTDTKFGLIRYDLHMDYTGLFPVIAKKYGSVFFIHTIYSYALNFISWILLVQMSFSKNKVYRNQALSLFFALSFIFFPNLLFVSRIIPSYTFDVTPAFFGPAGLIAAWGIFRMKLFDIVPVAWATVVRNMDAGVMVIDMQNRVLDINPAFERIVRRTAPRAIARQAANVCSEIPELSKACSDLSISRFEFSDGERATDSKVYEAEFSMIFGEKGEPAGRLVIANEITEKKRRQEELLNQQWKLAADEERARTARDLHDNLGQILGFINLQAQGIQQELKNMGITAVSDKLDRLVYVTQSAHTELRAYIHSIRSMALLETDFLMMLKQDISAFEKQTGLTIEPRISELVKDKLKPGTWINVHNIIREALNNIAKHSGATSVTISVSMSEEMLSVIIEDNGKGFEITGRGGYSGFGLDIMYERASEIGGKLIIDSSTGKGCRIMLQVPIEKKEKENETDAR
ncbi:MAG: histidine kinase N-terminal 7TM domain-containing protein [Oscillospiraceae bacterium]|nr:histidine kinase N-terminal 7TM domain-containing protein [Oscillospiraceae bacterium]